MKRYNHLFDQIHSFGNLLLAARKAQKGKRSYPNVAAFNFNLEKELIQLQEELREQTYQPGKYRAFYIEEPKRRMISAAPYRDRVVHHALCNIIAPLFERSFIKDSYANQKNKGTHKAVDRYQEFARKNAYFLKCDIRKYFPSIDHEILKAIIARKISCLKTNWLIAQIIDNSNLQEAHFAYFKGDDLFTPHERKKGLPIGNLSSQYFANIYLNAFDHFVKEQLRAKHYLRYVDDFVLFSNSKQELYEWKEAIISYLAQLRLLLHPNKSQVHSVKAGINFLGYRVYPYYRLLRTANVRLFKKRLKRRVHQYLSGAITASTFENSLNAWMAHASHASTYHLRLAIYHDLKNKGIQLIIKLPSSRRVLEQQSKQLPRG